MIETANYGRLSEALLIYQLAMQRYIARTLQTANNGAGDWFSDQVLTSLGGDRRKNLERNRRELEDGTSPEQLLDATHFPDVLNENWDSFRLALKDRKQVLRQTRQIKKWRSSWAHPSEKATGGLSDADLDEKLQTCEAVVERFNSEAASMIRSLRSHNPEDATLPTSISVPEDEPDSSKTNRNAVDEEANALREQVERWRQEQAVKVGHLRKKLERYQEAATRKAELYEMEFKLKELGSQATAVVQEEHDEAHIYQWEDCLVDLLRATFDAGYPHGHVVTDDGDGSGTIEFDVAEGNVRFDLTIKIDIH